MDISIPNEFGVLAIAVTRTVARTCRSFAAVHIARGEDLHYRYGVELHFSTGGFCRPIHIHAAAFADQPSAEAAGMEELLRRWPKPFPSEPQSVHDELRLLREQVERQLRQPSLFQEGRE